LGLGWTICRPDGLVRALSAGGPRAICNDPVAFLGGVLIDYHGVRTRKAELLEFHRDHRMYEWTSVTPIPIDTR
jgi:hypothetical protein